MHRTDFMRRACAVVGVAALAAGLAPAGAGEMRLKDVASAAELAPSAIEAGAVAFSDHKGDELADKVTGLVRFEDWVRTKPVHKKALGLTASYQEPAQRIVVDGVAKTIKRRLHVYRAEARFVLPRPPSSVRLADYAGLGFLEKVDPAIKHKLIAAADALPNKEGDASGNRNPDRRWCEPAASICVASRYDLEGKLPSAIRLANKLEEGGKKIPDFLEFQSELRALSPDEVAALEVPALTQLNTQVVGALAQSTFHVNQILAFGKLLAVFQAHPTDQGKTVVTAFVTLGIKSDVLEKKKEFERVPVLRNMLPAQVLVGASSFNTGSSISAGLPKYVRNQIRRIAELMDAGS